MRIDMGIVRIVLHVHESVGIANPLRLWHVVVAATGILAVSKGGIEGRC